MGNDIHESPDPNPLEAAIGAMRSIEVSGVPEDVVRRTRAALRASSWLNGRTFVLRIATAALVALALVGSVVVMTQTGPRRAFADVAERVQATKTLRGVLVDSHNGGSLFISGTRKRLERGDTVVISDSATHRQVMFDSKSKLAYQIPQSGIDPALDFYGLFRSLVAAGSKPIDDYVDKNGRHLFGFAGRADLKIGPETTLKIDAKVWNDPATKLPVRLEIRSADANIHEPPVVLDRIEFDVPLDDGLFDMAIPPGYRTVGLTADKLKPAPGKEEAEKLTMVPGVGIGDVKFGMSRGQIVAILGEPEFTLHDSYLCYPSKGLQLWLGGRGADRLGMIIANPADAASRVRNDFPGKTDKGVRIGSAKKEVLDAYGEPAALPPNFDKRFDIAGYDSGIEFVFMRGKVDQIIMNQKN